jgi:AAA15 family ATPase/GTPase
MNYSSLKITNFRSINNLEADDFRQINLITGRNNCGKTTVLEALFLISGMSNPQLPITINIFRDLVLTSDEDFSFIFNELEFNQNVEIRAGINNHYRTTTIKPKYTQYISNSFIGNDEVKEISESRKPITSTGKIMAMSGLSFEFSESNTEQKFTMEISLSENTITATTPNNYKENLLCGFLNTNLSAAQLDKKIEKILVYKQLNSIISIMQEVDERITDIRMGANGMIYADIGINKLAPINIMGDGTRRLLSIVANIATSQDGILLIDEIENGFHYTSLEILWRAIIKTAKIYNVQLFITTHSQECIAALASVYNKNSDDNDDSIRLYRIEKGENVHKVFKYTPDLIAAGMEDHYEVR